MPENDSQPPLSASPPADDGSTRLWLTSTALLDLDDPRLRMRAQALTQLSRAAREKALTLYGFVKRLPFTKGYKLRLRTARQVLDRGSGDAEDKATLLVALLRLAQVPARIRYLHMRGAVLRGLTDAVECGGRPVVEIFLDGQWQATDTYIFDAAYMAQARQQLRERDWPYGWGLWRDGAMIWTGRADAWLSGRAPADDPLVIRDLGHFHDPREFQRSAVYGELYRHAPRTLRWNLLAPSLARAVRDLRDDRDDPAAGSPRNAA